MRCSATQRLKALPSAFGCNSEMGPCDHAAAVCKKLLQTPYTACMGTLGQRHVASSNAPSSEPESTCESLGVNWLSSL